MSTFDVKKAESLTIEGYYYEGVAFLVQHRGNQFIVLAPNKETLAEVFTQIHGGTIDMSKVQPVSVTAPQNITISEMKTVSEMLKERKEKDYNLYWYIHPESDCCFVEYGDFISNDGMAERLGKAEKYTTIECKLLLRRLGHKREDIDTLVIREGEPIPF